MMFRSSALASSSVVALSVVLSACNSPSATTESFSISGQVDDIAGVKITASGKAQKSTLTDAGGNYKIDGLAAGPYTVIPNQVGYIFNPVETKLDLVSNSSSINFTRVAPEEGLSAEFLKELDAVENVDLSNSEIILQDGQTLEQYIKEVGLKLDGTPGNKPISYPQKDLHSLAGDTGPQSRKKDVIAKMLFLAQDYACGRSVKNRCTKYDYDADPNDPINKPAQKGLVYVWNGKTPGVRTGQASCTNQSYGMDCSGLIYNIAKYAGITIPVGTAKTQGNVGSWKIPAEWGLEIKEVTDGSIETGDIISWGSHIGISQGSGTDPSFISSTGSAGACLLEKKGPAAYPLHVFSKTLGAPKILRITAKLSGTFDMYIRCSDQNTDASIVRFVIDNDKGGAFTADGAGTDYNGAPLCFKLNGNYDPKTSQIDATLNLCDGTRVDQFSVKITKDDTGYFQLQKVKDNGGCLAQARLVRVNDLAKTVMPAQSQPQSGTAEHLFSPATPGR